MKRMLSISLLMLSSLPVARVAAQGPDQCFAQAKLMPADQQEQFLKACLGSTPSPPATVSPDQRAKVCESIAEREHFSGEQKATFLKGCKAG
ncbi:hypothetical protein [Nevskia ramosa]|uniref:hypothetical protein n=1 Tax=Nevskia ramosa TaxID=64002 RepID=UPI003D0C32D8